MLVHPGNHIGDSWYYIDGETVHCFYLTCPDNIERHTAWDIGHATSRDLVTWQLHDPVLRKGDPGTYDGICPATGSVLRFRGRYWMAYTGNWSGPEPTVAIAVSDDLFNWEKLPENPVTRIDPRYYDDIPRRPPRDWLHWRDPFLFEHEGAVYHYVCANKNEGPMDERGTLGLARTRDMIHWEVLPPVEVAPVCTELECPQVYQVGQWSYLLFSSAPEFFSEAFRRQHADVLQGLSSYAMVGQSRFGPFHIYGSGQIIPPDYPVQPYANQLVFFNGGAFLLGTVWDEQQDFICDPIAVSFTEMGIQIDD